MKLLLKSFATIFGKKKVFNRRSLQETAFLELGKKQFESLIQRNLHIPIAFK